MFLVANKDPSKFWMANKEFSLGIKLFLYRDSENNYLLLLQVAVRMMDCNMEGSFGAFVL